MAKENKIHLEWAKVYWPQDYEVVDELKKLKEENKKLKEELSKYKKQYEHSMWFMEEDTLQELKDI